VTLLASYTVAIRKYGIYDKVSPYCNSHSHLQVFCFPYYSESQNWYGCYVIWLAS